MIDSIVAYIGLGSNLNAPIEQVKRARTAIQALESVTEQAFSSLYSSPSMGSKDQPDYINAVMAIKTTLEPLVLLRCLQGIENAQGRVRTEYWGARTLDLDILSYDQRQINLPDLIVPHLGMRERAFVLYPLHEIEPDLIFPTLGAIKDLTAQCPLAGLKKL
ncbi:MAG: 2-amino-4-hydroxy-6-hydroxymethyldihydropteridine diphosphokinase [Methylococcales bacterium]|nr:2-amino-4-hydroxy-6-hydroxymethyldihydropteridine diphosphokinase [Methylococcales bacterium]